MKAIKNLLLYIWQLLQNLFGLVFTWLFPAQIKHRVRGKVVYIHNRFTGGISLGRYVILKRDMPIDIRHELGHCRQSEYLGPAYLFVVGIPSLIHAWLHGGYCKIHSYYHYWTERWADRLAGITRN